MKTLTSILLTILVITVASAQQPANPSSTETDKWRSFFMFLVDGRGYTIRGDGFGETDSRKSRVRNFNLRLDYHGHIEHLYFLEYENDLVLIYEASEELKGWGYVARLNQNTMKAKWVTPVNGYNIGPSLVEGKYAYLTAARLIAKLDLQSGAYAWQQKLQENDAFEAFRLPRIDRNLVFFKEDAEPGKTIEVDKTTGKILDLHDGEEK